MTRQGRLHGIILIVLIVLMQPPDSVPHPSENFIHVRIQMYGTYILTFRMEKQRSRRAQITYPR